jgi:hypothetical protein
VGIVHTTDIAWKRYKGKAISVKALLSSGELSDIQLITKTKLEKKRYTRTNKK